ncbi:MAG TPA: hypothetical protein VMT63_05735 [Bacteroidales bacterium]|nr:hypothetical protein [Bacteroidales bacterium]
MNELKKAQILTEDFGLYGIGNFSLTVEQTARIIEILSSDDCDEMAVKLKKIYNQLHFECFGYYIENLHRINHAPIG